MLQSILFLYLQGLLLSSLVGLCLSGIYLFLRFKIGQSQTVEERQNALFDLLLMNVLAIPILSFGMVAILLMLKV